MVISGDPPGGFFSRRLQTLPSVGSATLYRTGRLRPRSWRRSWSMVVGRDGPAPCQTPNISMAQVWSKTRKTWPTLSVPPVLRPRGAKDKIAGNPTSPLVGHKAPWGEARNRFHGSPPAGQRPAPVCFLISYPAGGTGAASAPSPPSIDSRREPPRAKPEPAAASPYFPPSDPPPWLLLLTRRLALFFPPCPRLDR